MSRPSPSRTAKVLAILLACGTIATFLSAASCGSTRTNRDPLGERLPAVRGETLGGEATTLPLAEPTLLLVGYAQDAQFDADRWLIGLLQAPPPVTILEVPAVAGLFPRMISGKIDAGMRSGIPGEDWESVVTVYGPDADQLVELTGNEAPRNIRVLLLDADGRVRWFHDRGFSASKLLELVRAASLLNPDARDLRFNVNKHDVEYLAGQLYFDPHPKELMLRNHC